jgi:hypothetical protein
MMNFKSFQAKLVKLSDATNGYIFYWFLTVAYLFFMIFVDNFGKIGLGINILSTSVLLMYRYFASEERYNSLSVFLPYQLALTIGNVLWFFDLFASLPIAMGASLAISIPFTISTYDYYNTTKES